jgi:heptaprenyl diphosphate synthase
MQFHNKKRIAYLSALTLLFSYAELLLPRIVPFFRLGLGNAAILMAFEMPFPAFLLLSVIKAIAASLMGGTLFSPFFIISFAQSVSSACLMSGLYRLNKACRGKLMSLYGISLAGSALSAFVQIWLCSLFLGKGTFSLLGPMMLFNTASGIITALIAEFMSAGKQKAQAAAPDHSPEVSVQSPAAKKYNPVIQICLAAAIILACAGIFFLESIPILCAALVVSFVLQFFSGRKIFIIPHISLWIFVLVSSLLSPNGKVLFTLWNFSITQGALFTGIEKALKLSAVSALSQCAASLRPPESSLLGLSLAYYRTLSDRFRDTKGNPVARLKKVLGSDPDEVQELQN